MAGDCLEQLDVRALGDQLGNRVVPQIVPAEGQPSSACRSPRRESPPRSSTAAKSARNSSETTPVTRWSSSISCPPTRQRIRANAYCLSPRKPTTTVPTPIATSQKAGLGEWVTNVTPLPACRPYNSGHVTRAGASVLTLLLRCYVRRVGARHAPARATSSEGRAERRSRPQVALSPRPFPRRPLRRPKRPGLVPLAGEGGPPLPAPGRSALRVCTLLTS
jgi:hypothetical protein